MNNIMWVGVLSPFFAYEHELSVFLKRRIWITTSIISRTIASHDVTWAYKNSIVLHGLCTSDKVPRFSHQQWQESQGWLTFSFLLAHGRLAALHGRLEVVQLLLQRCDYEADPRDSSGVTPLMDAARGGHVKVLQSLLQHNKVCSIYIAYCVCVEDLPMVNPFVCAIVSLSWGRVNLWGQRSALEWLLRVWVLTLIV